MDSNIEINYDLLAKKIAQHSLNLDPRALWSPADIAMYLRKSVSYVYQLMTVPEFPEGKRIDPDSRTKVWLAEEIMNWVLTNPGRPRKSSLEPLIAD